MALVAIVALGAASSPALAASPRPPAGKMTLPLQISLDSAEEGLLPGSSVTLGITVRSTVDIGPVEVWVESEGAVEISGTTRATLALLSPGKEHVMDVVLRFPGDGDSTTWVHARSRGPNGDDWHVKREWHAHLRTGQGLAGRSMVSLKLRAVENLLAAGKLTPEQAAAEARRIRTIEGGRNPSPVQQPRPPRSTSDRDAEITERLAIATRNARPQVRPLASSGSPTSTPSSPSFPPSAPSGAPCITVEGNVSWLDENGDVHPAFGMLVQVRDDDLIGSELVDEMVTGPDGDYSFFVDNDDGLGAGDRDIFVRFITANGAVSVEPAALIGNPYEADSPVHVETPCGAVINEPFLCANTGTGPSCGILEGGSWVAVYASDLNGGPFLGQLVVEWPGDDPVDGANYDGSDINLPNLDRFDWDVLHHEYGHYIQDTFDIEDNPGGPHNIGDCISDVHASKDEGVKMAWAEGWPTYNGTAAQQLLGLASLGVPRVGDTQYDDTEDSTLSYNLESSGSSGMGEDNEVAVQRLLWDIFDTADDDGDIVSFSDQVLFDVANAGDVETLSEYWAVLRPTFSNQEDVEVGEATVAHLIGSDLGAPADGSIVHPGNLDFDWSRAVGCSTTYDGDGFDLRFFHQATFAPLLTIPVGNTTSHVLSNANLATLIGSSHLVRWGIEARNGSSPATGPYLGENNEIVVDRPPVADAGPDQTVECSSFATTPATLDGTGSSDVDGDGLTYLWAAPGIVFDDPTSPTPTGEFPEGPTVVTLTVDDGFMSDDDTVVVTVDDTTPPVVTVTGPPEGSCHGTDVTVTFTVFEICDDSPTITYDPPGGPTYSAHGDYTVIVTATDDHANAGSDDVSFTIDKVAPNVSVSSPVASPHAPLPYPLNVYRYPDDLPIPVTFTSDDADGATGDVVHERIYLGATLIYDGDVHGDADGLLRDEVGLVVDEATLCASPGGLLGAHSVTITAEDCGGNVQTVVSPFEIALALPAGSLRVVPEAMRLTRGRLTAFLFTDSFPAVCGVVPTAADVDMDAFRVIAVTPMTSADAERAHEDANRFLIQVRRSALGPGSLGVEFALAGKFLEGTSFFALDTIMKNP